MVTKGDKILFTITALVVILLFVFWSDVKTLSGITTQGKNFGKENLGKEERKKTNEKVVSDVQIVQKWELPSALKEVSGIAYIDDQRFACIQDEYGTIFIFNRASNKIEKEIAFAEAGDFEGITVKGNNAYVVRADGRIYEVNMNDGKSSLKEYNTSLTAEHNVEGLCYDKNNNRLLLAIKDNDPGNSGYKGIYSFDLLEKVFIKKPVFKIDLQHELLKSTDDKKDKAIMPSALGIHPSTNNIFITDGPKAKLLIMDQSGKILQFLELGKEFSQPEGITFSPLGEVFISNEGSKKPGNIIKIELKAARN